jgi:hypothetical protein
MKPDKEVPFTIAFTVCTGHALCAADGDSGAGTGGVAAVFEFASVRTGVADGSKCSAVRTDITAKNVAAHTAQAMTNKSNEKMRNFLRSIIMLIITKIPHAWGIFYFQ